MLRHYVEFDTPGSFFPETEVRQVTTRIPARLRKLPKYTYAIEFFDVEEMRKGKELLKGSPKNRSRRIVFGEVVKQEDLPSLGFSEHTPLYHNADDTNKKVIKCITGNWQPWDKNWLVLENPQELKKLKDTI